MKFATGLSNLNDQRQLHTRTEAIFIAGQIGMPNALRKVPARGNKARQDQGSSDSEAGGRS
jgi:hypothetical protein